MSDLKRVFYGCEAFLCEVLGERRCRVWLQNPKLITPPYDKNQTIELDLDANPSNGLAGARVDDSVVAKNQGDSVGLTALGPRWPKSFRGGAQGHATEAGVWLEQSVWSNALDAGLMSYYPPARGTDLYRWQTVIYASDSQGNRPFRRYSGFHAKRMSSEGNPYTFQVWNATDDITKPGTTIEVNLNDLEQMDPTMSEDFTTSTEGRLFLRWNFLASTTLISPKVPIGEVGSPQFPKEARNPSDGDSVPRALSPAQDAQDDGVTTNEQYAGLCKNFSDGKPLNISHNDSDLPLQEVQNCLVGNIAIGSVTQGLIDAIKRLDACELGPNKIILDLISHSSSVDQVMTFGAWEMRAETTALKDFCDAIKPLKKIGAIRLIGCGTMSTKAGCDAAQTIENILNVPVSGTTTLVDLSCFDQRSYIGGYLRDSSKGPLVRGALYMALMDRFFPGKPRRIPASPVEEPWSWYESADPGLAGRARRTWNSILPTLGSQQGVRMPGLLLKPLRTASLSFARNAITRNSISSNGGAGEVFKMDILLNWKMLRVWHPSKSYALVYPISDEANLEKRLMGNEI